MDFRERIERNRPAHVRFDIANNNEQEEVTEHNFFAIESVRSQPACIDLRFADGSRQAVPYSYIMGMSYDAEEGIQLITSSKQVKIKGRDLSRLYDHLTLFRVKYIQENMGADIYENGLFVKNIIIEEI